MKQTLEARIAKILLMSDETWERHANPSSVWTRFAAPPVLIAAIWSRTWVGPWAWGLTGLATLWIWVNPRIFRKPASTDNWASKAVLGERVWINRKEIPVPEHHRLAPNLLSGLSGLGLLLLVWVIFRALSVPSLFTEKCLLDNTIFIGYLNPGCLNPVGACSCISGNIIYCYSSPAITQP